MWWTSTPPWGFFRRTPDRLGVAPGTASCLGNCGGATPALDFHTIVPCRIVDTRLANGPLGGPALSSGAVRDFDLTGTCGVPNTARAVSVNVTVTGSTGAGYVRFAPSCSLPVSSIISFNAGQTRANNAVVSLGSGGQLSLTASGTVDAILDVAGYFVE